jgi:P27 family predicted phage terminase small subunit
VNATTTKRPKPPEDLDGEALLEWQRVLDELDTQGRLDVADRAVLVLYAQTWAVNQQATQHVARYGSVIRHHNNVIGVNPFFTVQKQTTAQLRNLLLDLGLTPSTRKAAGAVDAGELNY